MRKILLLVYLILVPIASQSADYHIDGQSGDDSNDGSLVNPWKTLSRLNSVTLVAGDRVRLKRGSVFRENLEITESGAANNPIVIEAYGIAGSCNRSRNCPPIISAGAVVGTGAAWTMIGDSEFRLVLDEFSKAPTVVVRGLPSGIDSYRLLARGTKGMLAPETYDVAEESQQQVIYYKPKDGFEPADFLFELSVREAAVSIDGSWVKLDGIDGILAGGNAGLISTKDNVVFSDCRAAFGTAWGVAIGGPNSVIDNCIAEHNHSTGFYIFGSGATNGRIQNSISRFNGNLSTTGDRGGIGVQANDAILRRNVIHHNGNSSDKGGDAAVQLFNCSNALVENNLIVESVRGAIDMGHDANSYGHKIVGNVIFNWNRTQGTGTINTSAIRVLGFGNTNKSGLFQITNNTVYSDQTNTTLIGIQLGLPGNSDRLIDTLVLNNSVYFPHNAEADSYGYRFVREHLFTNVKINHNNAYLPLTENHYNTSTEGTISTAGNLFAKLGYEEDGLNEDPQFSLHPANLKYAAAFETEITSGLLGTGTMPGIVRDFFDRTVVDPPDIGALQSSALTDINTAEPLRLIRGYVNSTASEFRGKGFTASIVSLGRYTVSFDTPFTSPPTILITPKAPSLKYGVVPVSQNLQFEVMISDKDGNKQAGGFYFIAVGPQ